MKIDKEEDFKKKAEKIYDAMYDKISTLIAETAHECCSICVLMPKIPWVKSQ